MAIAYYVWYLVSYLFIKKNLTAFHNRDVNISWDIHTQESPPPRDRFNNSRTHSQNKTCPTQCQHNTTRWKFRRQNISKDMETRPRARRRHKHVRLPAYPPERVRANIWERTCCRKPLAADMCLVVVTFWRLQDTANIFTIPWERIHGIRDDAARARDV